MKYRRKKAALTLVEMIVVIAVVALLAGLSLPAVKALYNSMLDAGSARTMINAALSTARAIALKEQRYAGIRFQYPLSNEASQYMIYIIQDKEYTIDVDDFRLVKGYNPTKLPENIFIEDGPGGSTKLSIVFSPSGRLVIYGVQLVDCPGIAWDDQIFVSFAQDSAPLTSCRGFILHDESVPETHEFWVAPYTGELIEVQN